jgi:heme-degrading monooxygenase HmoA
MTTLTLFRYPANNLFWAFTQMRLAQADLEKAPGLMFHKLMGSGGAGGFGLWPNWRVYALLGIWESTEAWTHFQTQHPFALETHARCSEQMTTFLRPMRTHGLWDGSNPFEPLKPFSAPADAPVAVLTRARIRIRRLPEFLINTNVAKTSLKDQEDLLLSIGVGETPLIYQATFSIWKNLQAMQQYAYKTPEHAGVISKTRARDWYSEELFTRFHVMGAIGSWGGKRFLEEPASW